MAGGVATDSSYLQSGIKVCDFCVSSLSQTSSLLKSYYQEAGSGWTDKHYVRLGEIVGDCCKALSQPISGLNNCKTGLGKLLSAVQGYEAFTGFSATESGQSNGFTSSSSSSSEGFTYTLRGESITLNGVSLQTITYVKREAEDRKELRKEFDSGTRKAFLKELGNDSEMLKNAGFSEIDIAKIKNGRVPDGWQVHHILPLDDSGTNSFDNLVLIQNNPYHMLITNYQNSTVTRMASTNSRTVQWPIINGRIYPLHH